MERHPTNAHTTTALCDLYDRLLLDQLPDPELPPSLVTSTPAWNQKCRERTLIQQNKNHRPMAL